MLFLWAVSGFPTHFRLRGNPEVNTIARVGGRRGLFWT